MGLGLRAAAKVIGISHVALLKAAQSGRVALEPDGSYDPERCRSMMAANSNPVKTRAGSTVKNRGEVDTAPSDESQAEASRQLEWEKVRALQQKTDREDGTLADVAAVNAFVAGMIIKARDDLSRIGSESADELAQESNPAKCGAIVDKRIFQVLDSLKQYTVAA